MKKILLFFVSLFASFSLMAKDINVFDAVQYGFINKVWIAKYKACEQAKAYAEEICFSENYEKAKELSRHTERLRVKILNSRGFIPVGAKVCKVWVRCTDKVDNN